MNRASFFVKSFFGCLVFLSLGSICTTAGHKEVYLFSYFKGNGEDGLHLAYSYDGLDWKALNRDASFLAPAVGKDKLMRDPSIVRGPGGWFHMVWTVSWGEKGIGYACSKDLIHWSEQLYIPVMEHERTAMNCWAPEIFYDDRSDQYLICWATTIPGRFPESDKAGDRGYNHRIYYTSTRDFLKFSNTELLYNQKFNVIDAVIVQTDSNYMMFLKDETRCPAQKNIRIANSTDAEGPYGPPSEPVTGDYWAEGPTVIQIQNRWHLYFDKYRLHQYGLLVSEDLQTWTDKSHMLSCPVGMRHGTVFRATESVLNKLLLIDEIEN
ncbi:glycoside hydrolase family 43 protein [bacterium]|nr:glycoside hydrolase family 43 protein [bacterium]